MGLHRQVSWNDSKPPVGTQVDWGDSLNNNLQGCWLFNEGSMQFAYDIANNNTLTCSLFSAGGGLRLPGKHGASLKAPIGAARVTVGASAQLTVTTGGYTVEGLMQAPTVTPVNTAVLGKWNGNGWMLYIDSSNKMRVYANGTNVVSTASVMNTAGRWYHMVGVWNGITQRAQMYLNGVLDSDQALAVATITDAGIVAEAGKYNTGAGDPMNAIVERIRFWRRACTASEVMRMYAEPFAGMMVEKKLFTGVAVAPPPAGTGFHGVPYYNMMRGFAHGA